MKKKLLTTMLILLMIIGASCSSSKSDEKTEDPETSEDVQPEDGDSDGDSDNGEESQEPDFDGYYTPVQAGDKWAAPAAGITIDVPQSYIDNSDKVYMVGDGYEVTDGLYELYTYIYPGTFEELSAMDYEEFFDLDEYVICPLAIYGADSGWTYEDINEWIVDYEEGQSGLLEEIGKEGNYTYYSYMETEYGEGLDSKLKEVYDAIIAEMPSILERAQFSEPVPFDAEG